MKTKAIKVSYVFGVLLSLFLVSCSNIPAALDIDSNTWEIDGLKIHHFEKGKGEIILMVHGGPGIPILHPIPGLDPLTDKYRFIYFHQRGCGKSTRPITGFEEGKTGKHIWELISTLGYKNHIKDIESIRKNLGVEKIILMGHSFGAVLSSLYAQKYPDHVKAIILVAPAAMITSDPGVDMFKIIEQRLSESESQAFVAFKDEYFDFEGAISKSETELRDLNLRFGKYWLLAMGSKDTGISFDTLPTDISSAGGFMPYGLYFSFGRKWDFTPGLKKVSAPVLIIHGEKDLQPQSVSEIYLEHFPNADLEVIPKASHFPFVETPDEFNKLIEQFLNQIFSEET